jgi:uncharacterized protein
MTRRVRLWPLLVVLLVVVVLGATRLATFYTDVLWYRSVGFVGVFWTMLGTRVGLAVLGTVVVTGLLAVNLLLARRSAPRYRIPGPEEAGVERYREVIEPFARPLLLAVAVVVGLLSGLSLMAEWDTVLLWANGVEFGRTDPQFGRDLGFFVFTLPFYALVNSWLFATLALVTLLTAAVHYLFGGIRPQSPGSKLSAAATAHLSVLLAALVAVRAWGFWLDRYQLSYSERGTVTGLSYTDVNAQLLAYGLLATIAAVCAVLFLINLRVRGWLLPSAGLGILLVAAVILAGVYPAVIQRLQVAPQELEREEPYIERNLDLTRFAYGIDEVETQPFPARAELSPEEVSANSSTLESIRLWDPATLQNTYQQLQRFRPYYDFVDVDVDRYELDGDRQQLMLSVREINERDLESDTWQNQRLFFTHGFGLVSSRVSTAGSDGQPEFVVNDIPLTGAAELEVANPRVYFGENSPEYSVVGTTIDELDYPRAEGEPPQTYRYTGEAGVELSGMVRRAAFALRYGEPNMVLSDLIQPESRILFNRDIRRRVSMVAPFLQLDHDPYPVALSDRIVWVQDAYTITDMVPYSERVDLGALTGAEQRVLVPVTGADGQVVVQERVVVAPALVGRANYLRNSVKATSPTRSSRRGCRSSPTP